MVVSFKYHYYPLDDPRIVDSKDYLVITTPRLAKIAEFNTKEEALTFIEVLTDLIDNDTLIILGVIILSTLNPQVQEAAIGGLLGFMGAKGMKGK